MHLLLEILPIVLFSLYQFALKIFLNWEKPLFQNISALKPEISKDLCIHIWGQILKELSMMDWELF